MQEIRDFIYGDRRTHLAYLFGSNLQDKRPTPLGHGEAIKLEEEILKHIGTYNSFEILWSNIWPMSKESIAPSVPAPILPRLTAKTPFQLAMGHHSDTYITTWGISNPGNRWELLISRLPKIMELVKMQEVGLYDKVIVCQVSPNLSCTEVCEMIIHGGGVPRYQKSLQSIRDLLRAKYEAKPEAKLEGQAEGFL